MSTIDVEEIELRIAHDTHEEWRRINEFMLEQVINITIMFPEDARRIMRLCAITEQEWETLVSLDGDELGVRERLGGTVHYLYSVGVLRRRGVPGHGVYYRLNLPRG